MQGTASTNFLADIVRQRLCCATEELDQKALEQKRVTNNFTAYRIPPAKSLLFGKLVITTKLSAKQPSSWDAVALSR